MRKIALIFLAFVLISSISVVSADAVTVDETNFNIPDEYARDTSIDTRTIVSLFVPISMFSDLDLGNVEAFVDGNKIIGIAVLDAGNHDLDDIRMDVDNDTEKTISGKSGLLGESSVLDNDGNVMYDVVIFKYFENGKLYVIIAPDEATIEEVIP